ncbi:adenine phosphoribosyltransferase [Agromyces seonyuensis]|uniref:Adenine phosphoribosyltransferase n=1 Tax=Agromyces seonyuensis TaxID=2662446 RepID=A0A6I4NS97_9MICO|nr:adenine phosphoribosyltransferase [Agromyces seonyuensis]MWB97306.1 adenine phosphoribosyltransferase [Agromyces seonyuensis]
MTEPAAPQPATDDHAAAVARLILDIPDFPEPGVLFRDLTPVFADPLALRAATLGITEPFAGRFDHIGGIEARGFFLSGAGSALTGAGILAIRKAGKLPRTTIREEYALEYGTAAIEVHEGELEPGAKVLIVDDVLATGGTVAAAARLVERAGWEVAGISVVAELEDLGGRALLEDRYEVFSLLKF